MQNYYGQYPNPMFANMQMPIANNTTPQPVQRQETQNVFVPVANENVARNFPVAYGNTVIFKDEHEPKMYIKAMGYSQLESPVFEKYVRESQKEPISAPQENNPNTLSIDELKAEIKALKDEIDALKEKISGIDKPKRVKKEVADDE